MKTACLFLITFQVFVILGRCPSAESTVVGPPAALLANNTPTVNCPERLYAYQEDLLRQDFDTLLSKVTPKKPDTIKVQVLFQQGEIKEEEKKEGDKKPGRTFQNGNSEDKTKNGNSEDKTKKETRYNYTKIIENIDYTKQITEYSYVEYNASVLEQADAELARLGQNPVSPLLFYLDMEQRIANFSLDRNNMLSPPTSDEEAKLRSLWETIWRVGNKFYTAFEETATLRRIIMREACFRGCANRLIDMTDCNGRFKFYVKQVLNNPKVLKMNFVFLENMPGLLLNTFQVPNGWRQDLYDVMLPTLGAYNTQYMAAHTPNVQAANQYK